MNPTTKIFIPFTFILAAGWNALKNAANESNTDVEAPKAQAGVEMDVPVSAKNVTSMNATFVDVSIGEACRKMTSNGHSRSVFFWTLQWAADSAKWTTDETQAFLDSVPLSIRGKVADKTEEIIAYLESPQYGGLLDSSKPGNVLSTALQVYGKRGADEYQVATFGFDYDIGDDLIAFRAAMKRVALSRGETIQDFANAFASQIGTDANGIGGFLAGQDEDHGVLKATLHTYYSRTRVDKVDGEVEAIANRSQHVQHLGAGGRSLQPSLAERQRLHGHTGGQAIA